MAGGRRPTSLGQGPSTACRWRGAPVVTLSTDVIFLKLMRGNIVYKAFRPDKDPYLGKRRSTWICRARIYSGEEQHPAKKKTPYKQSNPMAHVLGRWRNLD